MTRYTKLLDDRFVHKTVNHAGWFVNPGTGVHIQGVERLWVGEKSVMKRHKYTRPLI